MAKEESKSNALTALDEYVLLGRSGLRVSPVCLGAMTFGEAWNFGSSKEESKKVFDLYRSKGGNFYDTANIYTAGNSERFLGEFLSGIRSEAVIATKYTIHPKFDPTGQKSVQGASPNGGGNSRKSMVENLDASLKSLQTGYVDVFYVHNFEGITPIEEIMRGLDDVVRSGKALYVAISDTPAWALSRANTIAELRGWTKFIALQTRYNLLERSLEFELAGAVEEFGMSICPWGILSEGFLTGKHTKGQRLEGSDRNNWIAPLFTPKNEKILEEVKAIGQEIGRNPTQVALNWVLQRPRMIPIFGAKNVDQLQDNLGALEFTLSPEHLKRLNAVSAPEPFFPFNFLARGSFFNNAGLTVKGPKNPFL